MNRLALGTVQFGLSYGIANIQGQIPLTEAKEILKLAQTNGINTLDTAIAYGDSEQRLGEIGLHDWQAVSKLPAIPDNCPHISQWVADAVNGSLKRLHITTLYGLLLHRPQQLLEKKQGEQLYAALQQLKHSGVVKKIGISIYDPAELDALCNRYQLDIVQAPFNILDRRLIETGWMSALASQNTELHVRSVFLQGLLLMKSNDRPHKFSRWKSLWATWEEWLEHNGLTPLQACLRYALSFSQISKVIVGIDSLTQLKEILVATDGPSPTIPDGLYTENLDLLNPANWAALS